MRCNGFLARERDLDLLSAGDACEGDLDLMGSEGDLDLPREGDLDLDLDSDFDFGPCEGDIDLS